MSKQTGSCRKHTSTFDYPIASDPNYITDREFFGVWNNLKKTWDIVPYFSYEKYPDMARIEAAAKEGNYELAKRMLYEYYLPRRNKYTTRVTSVSKTDIVCAELMARNVYALSQMNGCPIEIFAVDNHWKDICIDVLDFVKKAAGTEIYISFVIASIDKTDSYAEFYAKESGYAPTLSLVVNGKNLAIPAAKDTYIRAGSYAEVNYGNEKTMKVQESGTYQKFNSNTNRAYISFDISGLSSGDDISTATFNIKGINAGGNGEKELFLYWWGNSAWEEDNLVWNTFSDHLIFSCNDEDCWDYITDSKPSVKGKVCFFHRGNEQARVAALYDYTKDEKYAYTFIRQIMGLISNVKVDKSVMNALDISRFVETINYGFIRCWDSRYMTPEIFTAFLKYFWLNSNYLINNYFGKSYNNWGSYATLAVYCLCAFYPEFAVSNEWFEAIKTENERLNTNFALEDGSCIELGQGYINTLLGTLSGPIKVYNLTKVELPYNDYVWNKIHKVVECYYITLAPGYSGFNLGDSMDANGVARQKTISALKYWASVFPNDKYLEYFATEGKSGSLPDYISISYPLGLRTFMRSDWSDKALALAITAKREASHGHRDVMSLAMYAYGKYLLTDSSYGAILTGDTRDYMISAKQHNVVTANGKDQSINKDGRLDAVEIGDSYDYVRYSSLHIPDMECYTRSVLFLKEQKFWIVSDYIKPASYEKDNFYEQHWHMMPTANMTYDSVSKIIRSNFEDVNVMVVPLRPDEIDNVRTEDTLYAPRAGSLINSKKAVYEKTAKGNVAFDTLIIPLDCGESFSVVMEKVDLGQEDEAASCFAFTIYNNNDNTYRRFYYYHLHDIEKKKTVNAGPYSTDADVVLVEVNSKGEAVSKFVYDSTKFIRTNDIIK